jgi:hypothetical protein
MESTGLEEGELVEEMDGSKSVIEQVSLFLKKNVENSMRFFNDRNVQLRGEFRLYIETCKEERKLRKTLSAYLNLLENLISNIKKEEEKDK